MNVLGVTIDKHVNFNTHNDIVLRLGVVHQSAVTAWQAVKGGALQDVLEDFDSRTRGSAANLKKATSQRCQPARNMAQAWNSSEALRRAETLREAKAVAKKMAKEARHS